VTSISDEYFSRFRADKCTENAQTNRQTLPKTIAAHSRCTGNKYKTENQRYSTEVNSRDTESIEMG